MTYENKSLSQEEKEQLADRIVAVLKDTDPQERISALKAQVEAGDLGEDDLDDVVLAVSIAMVEHLRI